ncbi:terminase TerL endonuclease subunit [Bordetella bronchiseptica]|uniref:terminase TerL endonuclease subunit n=1 Tax=Bordetella bronchiseptica TaxID=518 RepID=UPI0004611C18|nr:terminase TerL endonuclease subunit [Bordetella bronchiseptica]KDD09839.1 putative phage terminase, large subunit [Bordetella bronchiseptica MBORD707]
MRLDLSCTDWEQRLREGRSIVPEVNVNPILGQKAVAIFNKLRLADVEGTPTMAEAGGEWFRRIVFALFASQDPVTRERLIRELFLLVPKKNNKTTGGALLMLTTLLLNQRPNGTMIMTAPVHDVAQLAYDAAAGAIELDEVLKRKLHVKDHLKTIIHRDTKAELRIMSFDPAALTGQKTVAALIDELHVVAKMSKASAAIRQLRGGMLPFPEAFMAFITTQSDGEPVGVFKDELRKARDIRDGKAQGHMLPVLYELPLEIQKDPQAWKDPAVWPMVTPNLGLSISMARLKEDMAAAERTSEEELKSWGSQHLNVEIGLVTRSDGWAGAEFWETSAESMTLDEFLDRCEVVVAGVDGGGLDDLLGLALGGREKVTRRWLHWGRAWAHKIVLKRRAKIASRLRDFEKDGDLVIVDTPGQDVAEVAAILAMVRARGLMPAKMAVGVDAVGIGDVVSALTDPEHKFEAEQIIGISQGYRLNGAIKTAERKLAGGELVHCGQPIMAWSVGNAKTEKAGNATYVSKAVSGSGKIDPLMALFNAVSLLNLNPEAAVQTSIYEQGIGI